MTREQADRARLIFLAAMAEVGLPIGDGFAWVEQREDDWFVCWSDRGAPLEVQHRASCLASRSVGRPHPCFWCWVNIPAFSNSDGLNPCALGDCRAPIEESA